MMRSMADWQLPLARAPLYFFFGTFFPARRASDSPMAMACLRLLTFAPEPPLRSVPRFISCIAFFTFRPLALLYFLAMAHLRKICPYLAQISVCTSEIRGNYQDRWAP